jgi:hypothetical protein
MNVRVAVGSVVVLLAGLSVPLPSPELPVAPLPDRAFVWNRDSVWQAHEAAFVAARAAGCADTTTAASEIRALQQHVDSLETLAVPATSPMLDSLEARFFAVSAHVAACPAALDAYLALQRAMGIAIKRQSRAWDITERATRDRLYRTLYGSRAALEEVLLQHQDQQRGLQLVVDEPSASPSAVVHGVRLHSGDILVSRGGYPTSALIARGSDFPGNFSHIGLVHIDAATREVSVVEAHIERGVTISSAEAYLADKKLRLMVLRIRADLPAVLQDPLLAHNAAATIRDRALAEHIPYDFAMNYLEPSRLFCSEVASSAYLGEGITLWTGTSTITSEGLRRWLGGFGVEHFETQEPSDLEYDPQLVVVAEWRDPTLLFQDHIDNAVTDAMLEGANRGDAITFAWYQLPFARLAKGASWAMGLAGQVGPIPEGMSPAAALRNRSYSARHAALAGTVRDAAATWQRERGYPPAYWTKVELARTAVASEQ